MSNDFIVKEGFNLGASLKAAVGTVTGNATLDLSTGNDFSLTPTANVTFTFSNPPATGAYDFTLKITGADVSTSYDLANASYDTVSFSVASQGGTGRAIRFNNNGTKMYYLSDQNNAIYQYSLSSAFDISTASYDTVSLDVSGQDTDASHFNFNANGSKIYFMGFGNDTIYQYSLSSNFDLSTATYDSVSFSVGSQETTPYGFSFNTSGTKMYVVGIDNDRIYQYSLSSAFDLSSASYDSVSFNVTNQETGPTDIAFNGDGTKMFVTGFITDSVYQYSLSSAFDISTASYDSISFNASTQIGTAFSVCFNADGTKMYLLNGGGGTAEVFQYTTGTAPAAATFTYPAPVKWPAGTPPTAPADGETDVLTFFTTDGGTTYYGIRTGDDMS